MILRRWFRAAFWFRRGRHVPVEALEPWAGDSRTVEHLDGDLPSGAAGFIYAVDPTEAQEDRRARRIMGAWWALVVFSITAGLLAFVTAGRAEERRVDLYDLRSNRVGAAIVDDRTGRVDLYDAGSRRVGWGRITPGAHGEPTWRAYRLDGRPANPSARPGVRGDRR